jgi:WD40 repeat protein/transcriptional regulator with XRE-family HTH domain
LSSNPDLEQIRTRSELAEALTVLRTSAGLTIRALAERLAMPTATVGDYVSGKHLPGSGQVKAFRAIIEACGVNDPEVVRQWLDALARARGTSDGRSPRARAPYRGLEAFGEGDADMFFGREAAVEEVLGHLSELPAAGSLERDHHGTPGGGRAPNGVVLIGASGSGKSSLLAAGVMPAVRAGALGKWSCAVMTPGTEPLKALERCLSEMAGTDGGAPAARLNGDGARASRRARGDGNVTSRRHLIVVDQFEEALSAQVASTVRDEFLTRLFGLGPSAAVLIGLRADFYAEAARQPQLLALLRSSQVILGPMNEAELRRAIVGPAERVGVAVEEALVDLLLADLAPRGEGGDGVGTLPLLSHALLVTWQRTHRNQLTVVDYKAAGGLRDAVCQSAEDLYNGLSPEQQELARRMFLRLVNAPADGPVTKRRAARQELEDLAAPNEDGGTRAVVERFVAGRLLTAGEATVELSHEALLWAWPRLTAWVEEDRDGLRLHRQLTEAANTWAVARWDESLLLRGGRLEAMAAWAAGEDKRRELNRAEQELLDASSAHAEAERMAARRRTRRMQQLLAATAALALAAVALAVVAFRSEHAAVSSRDQALSRDVAAEAQQLASTQPALSAQLALAAYHISHTVEARSALIDATDGELPNRLLGPPDPDYISFDGSGHLMAVARSANDTVQLYSLASGHPEPVSLLRAGPARLSVFAVALDPAWPLLVAGGEQGRVSLFDLKSAAHPREVASLGGSTSTVYSVAFSPNGRWLAAASNDGTVRQWQLSGASRPTLAAVTKVPGSVPMKAIAYSPSSQLLAAGGGDGALLMMKAGEAASSAVQGAGTSTIESLAWGADGHLLVAGGDDTLVHVFAISGSGAARVAHAPLRGPTSIVDSLSFGPGGRLLAEGDADGSVRLWDTATWTTVATLQMPDQVASVAISPDGAWLASADSGGSTELWPLPGPGTYQASGSVFFLQFLDRGKVLESTSGGPRGNVQFWGVKGRAVASRLSDVGLPPRLGPVGGTAAVSPNGRLLAAADLKGSIQLFDISNLRRPVPIGSPLLGAVPLVEVMAFTPNGKVLAEGDDSGEVRLWDVADPSRPLPLARLVRSTGKILGLAVSPDGKVLAAASTDGHVYLWGIGDPAHPKLLATVPRYPGYLFTTAFSPNGKVLAEGGEAGTVRLWGTADPSHLRLLAKLRGPGSDVFQLAISTHGTTLAAATTSSGIWLWGISRPLHPVLLADLEPERSDVFALAFSPTGHVLVASGADQTLSSWQYDTPGAARTVCSSTGAPITPTEWAQYVKGALYRSPCKA